MDKILKVHYTLQFDNGLQEWRAVQPVSFSTEHDAEQKFHSIKENPRDYYNRATNFRIVKVVQTKTIVKHLP